MTGIYKGSESIADTIFIITTIFTGTRGSKATFRKIKSYIFMRINIINTCIHVLLLRRSGKMIIFDKKNKNVLICQE